MRINYSFATSGRQSEFANLQIDLLGSSTTSRVTSSTWDSSSPQARYDRLGSASVDVALGGSDLDAVSGSKDIWFGLNSEAAEVLSSGYGTSIFFAFRESPEGTDNSTIGDDTSLVTISSASVTFYYATVPSLTSPSDGASRDQGDAVAFAWSSDTTGTVAGINQYHVQFSRSSTFSGSTVYYQENLGSPSTTWTPPDDGDWYWRVRTYRANNGHASDLYRSDWSSTRRVAINNEPPTVSSLTATPSSAYRGDAFTLTANNVWDADGVPDDVYFYRDSNNSGAWDSSDEQLGRDLDLNDGWRWQGTLDPTWGIGTQRFLARVLDDDGAWSTPVAATITVQNRAPSVGGISITPSPVQQGSWITIQAMTVLDPDLGDSVSRIEFWRDSNFNGILDSGDHHLSPDDANSSDGWTWAGSADWSEGRHRLFAKAVDAHGSSGVSPPADVDVVTSPSDHAPFISGALLANPATLAAGQSLTLTVTGVSDDFGVSLVRFFRDGNGNGVFDSNDPALSPDDTSSSSGWAWSGAWQAAWGAGSRVLFARAMDTANQWSNVVSTTLSVDSQPPPPGDSTPPNWAVPVMDPLFDTGISNSDRVTRLRQPEFSWSRPTDPGSPSSGVTRYAWQIHLHWGGILFGTINNSGSSVRLTPPSLPGGNHTLFVRAFDAQGNGSTGWGGVRFTIDPETTPPPMPTELRLAQADDWGPSRTDGITWVNNPLFTWSQGPDTGAGLSGRYSWQAKNSASQIVASGVSATAGNSLRLPTFLPDGRYTMFMRTEDVAGNWSTYWASTSVLIDRALPTSPSVFGPPPGSTVNSPAFLQWGAGSDMGSGMWGYKLEVRDEFGIVVPVQSADIGSSYTRQTSWSLSLQAGRRYTWAIRSVDWAGLHSGPTEWRELIIA